MAQTIEWPESTETRPCPYCGTDIPRTAIYCKYCQRSFDANVFPPPITNAESNKNITTQITNARSTRTITSDSIEDLQLKELRKISENVQFLSNVLRAWIILSIIAWLLNLVFGWLG